MPAAYAEVVRKIHINKEAGRSNDPLLVFKQFFSTFKPIWRNMERKSLNGHATVVGGHATVDRLSNNDSSTFHAIRKISEKSRWTVTRQWLEVTKPSADCQTTSLGRFKQLGKIVGRLSNNVSWTFQVIRKNFLDEKKNLWTVTWQWSEVTRPSADCQATFFGRFKQLGEFSKKSHWTVTRQWSEVTRPSADCQTTFFGRFKKLGKLLKKVAERSPDSGRRSRDRLPTVEQRFLDVWSN